MTWKITPRSSYIRTFYQIHQEVQAKLRHTSEITTAKQHKRARPVSFQVGVAVMAQTPEQPSKHSPKITDPYKTVHVMGGNKYLVFDTDRNSFEVVHSDKLKKTVAEATAVASTPATSSSLASSSSTSEPQLLVTSDSASPSHAYNLRPRSYKISPLVPDMPPFAFVVLLWHMLLAIDPAHLSPGALTTKLATMNLLEDVMWVRYPHPRRLCWPLPAGCAPLLLIFMRSWTDWRKMCHKTRSIVGTLSSCSVYVLLTPVRSSPWFSQL